MLLSEVICICQMCWSIQITACSDSCKCYSKGQQTRIPYILARPRKTWLGQIDQICREEFEMSREPASPGGTLVVGWGLNEAMRPHRRQLH